MEAAPLTCRDCRAPRPPGRTRCAPCHNAERNAACHANLDAHNEKRRNRDQQQRTERRVTHCCVACAAPLPPDAPTLQCDRCRDAASEKSKRKQRADDPGRGVRGNAPYHVGRHVKANLVRILSVKAGAGNPYLFDIEALTNVRTLKHRERERRIAEATAAGITDPGEIALHADMAFHTSALLRETIRAYQSRVGFLPPRTESKRRRGKFSVTFHFGVDAETLAIITHYAGSRGVSVPRTVRDLVCAATYPPDGREADFV